ncbi:tyrosine-type recombinase/integrase [Gemmatimonas sp.]
MTARGKKVPVKRTRKPWSGSVGHEPHLVWYGERVEKNYRVYLRWRVRTGEGERATNWKWRSLKLSVRDALGVVDPARAAAVHAEATTQYRILSGHEAEPKGAAGLLTLRETWPVLTAQETGSLPTDSPYRREIEASLTFMRKVLGDDFAWVDLDYEQLQRLVRAKADEVVRLHRRHLASLDKDAAALVRKQTGLRAAEVVGTRALTMVSLLRRKHSRIPLHAPIPSGRGWREDLQKYVAAQHGGDVPEPERPRHTLDEVRRILRTAPSMDARVDLVLQLGAEYRSGQVVRAMRSQLDTTEHTFLVKGRGKKLGTTVMLTSGQQASVHRALSGYLRQLEAAYLAKEIADYPLFPSGRLRKGEAYVARHATAAPIHKRTMNDRFHAVEIAAGVTPVPGRAFYGVRRTLLDAAVEAGLSEEALQEHGGWSNSRTPRDIYRDKQRPKAQKAAADTRAEIRGEPAQAEPSDQSSERPSPSS